MLYWREKELSGEVTVRPDGKISLPLLNDVTAAGLTPSQLRDRLTESSRKFVEDPNVTVVVRQMNSRKVFITGEVVKPGFYPLTGPATVLQLIAIAGGLKEYANAENISILRMEEGKSLSFRFNYRDVAARRNLAQNIQLRSATPSSSRRRFVNSGTFARHVSLQSGYWLFWRPSASVRRRCLGSG